MTPIVTRSDIAARTSNIQAAVIVGVSVEPLSGTGSAGVPVELYQWQREGRNSTRTFREDMFIYDDALMSNEHSPLALRLLVDDGFCLEGSLRRRLCHFTPPSHQMTAQGKLGYSSSASGDMKYGDGLGGKIVLFPFARIYANSDNDLTNRQDSIGCGKLSSTFCSRRIWVRPAVLVLYPVKMRPAGGAGMWYEEGAPSAEQLQPRTRNVAELKKTPLKVPTDLRTTNGGSLSVVAPIHLLFALCT
ncbi:hypothetical protein BDQ17DRAFT_1426019 [Cyathus striatus]|nr:hypothetical protein BDQ17DRAFT_1426019 [Cyathus striatus]